MTPNPYYSREKFINILYRTAICAILSDFFLKFSCHGNSLCFLKNSDSKLEFTTPQTPLFTRNISRYLIQKHCWNMCSFALFRIDLVAMETLFAPWKIQIAYLNLPTPKTVLFARKISRCLVQNWNTCNFALFPPHSVAIAGHFAPLKIKIAYWMRPRWTYKNEKSGRYSNHF